MIYTGCSAFLFYNQPFLNSKHCFVNLVQTFILFDNEEVDVYLLSTSGTFSTNKKFCTVLHFSDDKNSINKRVALSSLVIHLMLGEIFK